MTKPRLAGRPWIRANHLLRDVRRAYFCDRQEPEPGVQAASAQRAAHICFQKTSSPGIAPERLKGDKMAEVEHGSVQYEKVGHEYFAQRTLRKYAGIWSLWA